MKTVLLILSVCIINSSHAKNYYFSSISGDDSRTSLQAESSATPWKTLSKLNTFFASLQFGDSILFKRGETFNGSITASKSGSIALPIVIGAYGIGAKPVISGFTTLVGWVSAGNNIFESFNAALGTAINIVTINGAQQPQGRYPNYNSPNKGYLTFETHGTNYITDNELTSAITWTGAELVVRPKRWILDRTTVTAHSGTRLTYSPALTYDPYDKYGYFLQNHVKTLDVPGEWYYNPSTKKVSVFSMPGAFQASTVNILVTVSGQNNIVFDNLVFKGSNQKTIYLYHANNIRIANCDVLFSGIDAVNGSTLSNLVIENSTISNTNSNAINLTYNCNYTILRRNIIKNTGIYPGLGATANNTYQAITINGKSNLIEYNQVDSTGFAGIRFSSGDSNIIKNNFINYFTLVKDDGGGINTGVSSTATYYGQKIIGNIVLNGIGVAEGTDRTTSSSNGIYLDDNSANVEISDNTVSNCGNSGMILHNSAKLTVKNNTLFNNVTQLILAHDLGRPDILPRNYVIRNNILFSKTSPQTVSNISTLNDDIKLIGSMDTNYYCRPVDDNLVTKASYVNLAGTRVDQVLDLKDWQTKYNLDKASTKTPAQVPLYTVSASGLNKLANGSFNLGNVGLYSSATSSWNSSKLDGGTFQASNASATTSTYSVIIAGGVIAANKYYLLKFSSQSAKDTIVSVYLRLSAAPYTKLSDIKLVKLSTLRQENEFLFSLPIAAVAASIIFEAKCPKLTFWLDNIEFTEANVTMNNPDDFIRFEYNATETAKVVPLTGTYVDSRNNTYPGVITIAPYSSAVLVKRPDQLRPDALPEDVGKSDSSIKKDSDRLLANGEESIKQQKSGNKNNKYLRKANISQAKDLANIRKFDFKIEADRPTLNLHLNVIPNPTHTILFVSMKGLESGTSYRLFVLSLTGALLKSYYVSTSALTIPVDISSLVNGLYILKAVVEKNSDFKQFVKI